MDARVQRLAAVVVLLAAAAHAQSADCPCITTADVNYSPHAPEGTSTTPTCRNYATVTSAKTDDGCVPAVMPPAPQPTIGWRSTSPAHALHGKQYLFPSCRKALPVQPACACVND